MISAIILLVLIIFNLVAMSMLAFLGKKNWLLFSAIMEVLLSIAFAWLTSFK